MDDFVTKASSPCPSTPTSSTASSFSRTNPTLPPSTPADRGSPTNGTRTRIGVHCRRADQDVLDTITGWDGITVTPATPTKDGLPTSFELRGPEGPRVDAEVSRGSIAGEWTLEFNSPEMELTAEISSEYDANSRVWLGREDSFDMYPPISLVSGARRARPGPYPALAGVWQYLIDRKNQPARDEEDDEDV